MKDARITTPRTRSDEAYVRLRQDLLDGGFEPESRLRVEHLRDRYALGATPLREALSRLSAEGLVQLEGQRGFRVPPVSLDELDDITDMRALLEVHAVARSIEAGDDAWEGRVVGAYHRLAKTENVRRGIVAPFVEWEARNREFHDALISACASRWLRQFRGTLYAHHERYRKLAVEAHSPRRNVAREHRAIFEAALDRDVARASELVSAHVRLTAETLHPLFEEDGGGA